MPEIFNGGPPWRYCNKAGRAAISRISAICTMAARGQSHGRRRRRLHGTNVKGMCLLRHPSSCVPGTCRVGRFWMPAAANTSNCNGNRSPLENVCIGRVVGCGGVDGVGGCIWNWNVSLDRLVLGVNDGFWFFFWVRVLVRSWDVSIVGLIFIDFLL